jgi:hypothetical protein
MTANTAHIDAMIGSAEPAAPQVSKFAPKVGGAASTACPYCGRPDTEPFQVLSRHRTSSGLTVWTRCQCGSLQVRERDAAGERIAARSRPRGSQRTTAARR